MDSIATLVDPTADVSSTQSGRVCLDQSTPSSTIDPPATPSDRPSLVTPVPGSDSELLYTPAAPVESRQSDDADFVAAATDALAAANSQQDVIPLADAILAAMIKTMRTNPSTYVTHLIQGTVTSLYNQVKDLLVLARDLAKSVFEAAFCVVEYDVARQVAVTTYLSNPTGNPPNVVPPAHCEQMFNALDALEMAATKLAKWMSDPGTGSLKKLALEGMAMVIRLCRRLEQQVLLPAASDAAKLGALHGAILGNVISIVLPGKLVKVAVELRGVTIAKGVSAAEAAVNLEKAGELQSAISVTEKAATSAESTSALADIAGAPEVDPDLLAEQRRVVASECETLLKDADANDINKWNASTPERIRQSAGAEDISGLVTKIYQTLPALLDQLRQQVMTYRLMKKALDKVNYMVKVLILTESSAAVGVADGARMTQLLDETAAAFAGIRAEEEAFEAAHIIDAWIFREASGPLLQDFAEIGITSEEDMWAIAAPRAQHRTTLKRLQDMGAGVPTVTAGTMTSDMKFAIVASPKGAAAGALVVDENTRLVDVIKKTSEVLQKKYTRSVWPTVRDRLFKDYRTLLADSSRYSASEYARVTTEANSWQEYVEWAAANPATP